MLASPQRVSTGTSPPATATRTMPIDLPPTPPALPGAAR
ncbi:hypothetical protein Lcho_2948 [Leptothrix cholodnii SP-6]|uniref:Uncharacterized protein n=1 Tax=Leptothrix cholodnii (strain ATCC 51168 / LMG 8142 / SP-6) TaxID=395495 RepID=B1XYG8_LEPCP|nr:hypothetical protein Lcho_2948 [Leptothrix cholodnii SP-6]